MKENTLNIAIALMLIALVAKRVFPDFCMEHIYLWTFIGGSGALLLIYSLFYKWRKGNNRKQP
jgi:hypothetical protein